MREVRVIGMDLAKNTFQLHGVDVKGKTDLRKKPRREQVVNFFANLPDCLLAWRPALVRRSGLASSNLAGIPYDVSMPSSSRETEYRMAA